MHDWYLPPMRTAPLLWSGTSGACLLAAIYHWCLHLWMVEGFRSAEDERDFRTVFVSLFHKEDQELAQGWLERTETQDAQ